jgi:hypothetical protein
MDKNKELALLLDDRYGGHHTPDGTFVHTSYRDYSSDDGKVQLLRLMMERKDWTSFNVFLGCRVHDSGSVDDNFVDVSYITDTSGKLRDACLEWLRKEKAK